MYIKILNCDRLFFTRIAGSHPYYLEDETMPMDFPKHTKQLTPRDGRDMRNPESPVRELLERQVRYLPSKTTQKDLVDTKPASNGSGDHKIF